MGVVRLTGLPRFQPDKFHQPTDMDQIMTFVNPGVSSPKTPSASSSVVPSLTEKNSKKSLLPQQLVLLSWDSSDFLSNSFIFPSTTSLWGHRISSKKFPCAKTLPVGL